MGLSKTGMSCLLMARVIGCSRVPVPPARMIPRMSGNLLQEADTGTRFRVPTHARYVVGQGARGERLGERRRGGVLRREHRRVRRPVDAQRGVERVDTVFGARAVDVVAEVDDGAVRLQRAETVPEAFREV